ncbi:acetyltransferase [Pseudoalteromonas luteoviolacea]|nr:acetyltransferase [Pseudoalteromonas luteoviolacea]
MLAELLELYDVLHQKKREKFSRSVPLPDLFVDRWERASSLNFGIGTSMYDSCLVLGDVNVGENTWIGPNVILDGSGGLKIGDNCSISANVQIYSHDSVSWAISGGEASYDYAETCVGSNCYIGPNVVIAKGVSIGSGAVVGANSFVNKDVVAGARVAGNPAKPIE